MIKVIRLEKYTPAVAGAVRALMMELSRSGKDKGEIPAEWFNDVIASLWHDLLLAVETEPTSELLATVNPALVVDGQVILGMATLSIMMGAGVRKNAYLEDFVVTAASRGTGVSGMCWDAMIDWAREKGARRLEFTCGQGRDAAQAFYKKHGATIYDTNFFRYDIEE